MRREPMPSDLPILDAEQYDGMLVDFTSIKLKKSSPSSHSQDGPRKRAKIATLAATEVPGESEGEPEEKKRARGRPRLDTKDETAADRRRTQIRLAQRAYRSRKENAIQSLETKVQELEDLNEEMSNAFMKLHDFAVSHGLLERAPEFGRQLQLTTKKFLALARRSDEDGRKDGEESASPEQDPRDRPAKRKRQPEEKEKPSLPDSIEAHPEPQQDKGPLWGYVVTDSDGTNLSEPRLTPDLIIEPDLSTLSAPKTTASTITTPLMAQPLDLDYEVVTVPTIDNASFPFGLNPDSAFPDIFAQATPPITVSPYSALPLPNTYAFKESTFGRRLQRTAIQRGYQLISMANPPKEIFAKVFGFCMLFEPVDKIRERLRWGLEQTKDDSLNYWQAPFWHLGGAGSSYSAGLENNVGSTIADARGRPSGVVGNQGKIDKLKHSLNSGFNMGPFDAKTTESKDHRLDPRMRIVLPGFQGDFYDADEVEMYLQSRGVTILPGQDFLTTEVDVTAFDATDDDTHAFDGLEDPLADPHGLDATESYSDTNSLSRSSSATHSAALSPSVSSGGASATDSSSSTVPDMSNATSVWSMSSLLPVSSAGDDVTALLSSTSVPGGLDESSLLAFTGTDYSHMSTRKVVTLNVNEFIKELVGRATCLGRSPGFRPQDVNASFWKAARYDDILGF